MARPLLLGHRGVRVGKAPAENTLAAFDYALALGGDGFEFDVRITTDQQAVICHDATVRKNRRSFRIAECNSRKLDLPSLREVLMRYRETAFLDIELKVPGLERTTVGLLRELPISRGFVVSSFLPEVIESVHEMNSSIPLGLICDTPAQLRRWSELPVGYVIPHYKLVRKDLVAGIQGAGKKIMVWTVNLPGQMKRLGEWGVDGIISDDVGRLAGTFIEG